MAQVDAGTRISQQFRVLRSPKVLSILYAVMIPAHRDRTVALAGDLTRLGTVATGSRTPVGRQPLSDGSVSTGRGDTDLEGAQRVT